MRIKGVEPQNREHEIIRQLYRAQGTPPPDWPTCDRTCRQAMLAGIRAASHHIALAPDLIDDLMQDTRVRLYAQDYRALRELTGPLPAALFGLLRAMAANTTVDYFRYRQCQKRSPLREVPLDACRSVGAASTHTERELMLASVDRALPRIVPPDRLASHRRIFWLYHRQRLTAREIAALPEVALSVKGVESILRRTLEGLRRVLVLKEAAA